MKKRVLCVVRARRRKCGGQKAAVEVAVSRRWCGKFLKRKSAIFGFDVDVGEARYDESLLQRARGEAFKKPAQVECGQAVPQVRDAVCRKMIG